MIYFMAYQKRLMGSILCCRVIDFVFNSSLFGCFWVAYDFFGLSIKVDGDVLGLLSD